MEVGGGTSGARPCPALRLYNHIHQRFTWLPGSRTGHLYLITTCKWRQLCECLQALSLCSLLHNQTNLQAQQTSAVTLFLLIPLSADTFFSCKSKTFYYKPGGSCRSKFWMLTHIGALLYSIYVLNVLQRRGNFERDENVSKTMWLNEGTLGTLIYIMFQGHDSSIPKTANDFR